MILQIRKRVRRRSILILCILTALAAICIALCFNDFVAVVKGPELLTKENLLNATSYDGNYVTVKDAKICAEFAVETRVSSKTLFKKIYRYYLCSDNKQKDGQPVFFAIRISDDNKIKNKVPVNLEKELSYAPSYSSKGTLHKLNPEATTYFNVILDKIGEFENTDQSVPYYIDDGSLNGVPIMYPIAIAIIALVFLAAALLVFIRYLRMSDLSDLVQEIYQNPKEELANLEAEFDEAKTFGDYVRISKNYIFWQTRSKEKIIPLASIKKIVLPDKEKENGDMKVTLILKNDKKLYFHIPEESSKDMVACLPINEQ